MLLSLSSQLSAELRVLRVWGQLCSVVSVEEKKGAENEVQLAASAAAAAKKHGVIYTSFCVLLYG